MFFYVHKYKYKSKNLIHDQYFMSRRIESNGISYKYLINAINVNTIVVFLKKKFMGMP